MNENYRKFQEIEKKRTDINSAIALMSWDREVNMPASGAFIRAQQMATLTGILHTMSISNEYEKLLDVLMTDNSLSFVEKRNVQESHRLFLRNKKLPTAFVEKLSHAISDAFKAWLGAKEKSDFRMFVPKLDTIVNLKRESAELIGYEEHPYDALMNDYEPGLTTSRVTEIFASVRKDLTAFFNKIKDQEQPDINVLNHPFSADKQMELCRKIISDLGYRSDTGRLDISAHPFSTSFGPGDSRITTRVNTNELQECIWGAIHEVGHGFYELGLNKDEYGMAAGDAASLSIHESQSRLWENNVGKSEAFINAYWPDFQLLFPEQLGKENSYDLFKALNIIQPDLIRINSDEVTYHFHILLRFEIEKDLIEGSLKLNDLEDAWNSKVKEYLDIDVPNASVGVLQDIHWSHGSFGYFPTYSLGSFYAAQFFETALKALPDLQKNISERHFAPLLQWLQVNIHQKGRLYFSEDLCEKVTGEKLNYAYFSKYLNEKYSKIYNLD